MAPKHILLVTQDMSLQATRVALLKREGYEVDAVRSAAEALHYLRGHRYDLVLIGRDSREETVPVDERLAEAGVDVPVLKIDDLQTRFSRAVGTRPRVVLSEVRLALFTPTMARV